MSNIVELRQYTLKPGQRDVLIELFEREFIESQEALGMEIFGTFRNADDPDRFVWLRGFPDMDRRAQSLAAFYGGPVWEAHREVANATMIDSDNVLLLRPAWETSMLSAGERAPPGTAAVPKVLVTANICYFEQPVPASLIEIFRRTIGSFVDAAYRARVVGAFVQEPAANSFPALTVRRGENVLVWFTLFADANARPAISMPAEIACSIMKPVETLRLLPTARSRLHAQL